MNWNDPAFLRSASALIQWIAIALASVAVCLQTAKHFVDLREKRISSALSSAKDEAQRQRELDLRTRLEISEKRVRSLSLRISFEAFAKWKGGKPPNPDEFISVGSAVWLVQLTFVLKGGQTADVQFRNDEALTYTRLSDGVTSVSYWVTAAPGSKIFSANADEIEAVRDVAFTCLGFNKDQLDEQAVTIGSLKLLFTVNGHEAFTADFDVKRRVEANEEVQGDFRLKLVRESTINRL